MAIKFISDMKRVWKVTKKPNKKEYFQTAKIVLIGFLIIGLIGLIVHIIDHLLIKRLFI